MANNRYKLENMLISSSAHLRSLELKAYFKAIKDLHFDDGLPDKYFNQCMTRMQGNRYVMHARNYDRSKDESYFVDVDTLTTERLDLNNDGTITKCFVEGDHMLLVRYDQPILILRDLQKIGYIEFIVKREYCKNDRILIGRYVQQAGQSVYAVDAYTRLYRIEWQDIKDGRYVKTLVKSNVNNFCVDRRLGLATLNLNHTLSLPNGTKVDLKAKFSAKATWTIVTSIAKCWIVCGDLDLDRDGYAIMAGISNHGYIISTLKLKLKLTSNGYKNRFGYMYGGIYSLHQVYVRGRRGIILAIERDGCCHLISGAYGRMSKLQSIASIVNVDVFKDESDRIVDCVTATGIEGEFIAGGWNWTKKITLKLK